MNPKYYINTEVTKFLKALHSLKNLIWLKSLQIYHSPIHYASFEPFGAKIGLLFAPQSVFEVSSKIVLWARLVQNQL